MKRRHEKDKGKGDRIGKIDARHMCTEGYTINAELWKETGVNRKDRERK